MGEGAFLGLDIGGTGIKGLRLDPDGRTGARVSRPTPRGLGAEAVLVEVAAVLKELSAGCRIASVGVGTPGAVDARGVVVAEAVNIPGWKGTDLASACEAATGAPAVVRNDANLAAYAEWAARQGSSSLVARGFGPGGQIHEGSGMGAGAGRNPRDEDFCNEQRLKGQIHEGSGMGAGAPRARNLLFVGLGTGIGGGYIEDGRILGGTDDRAVELGHVVIRPRGRLCACGRSGCLEAYAAGPAIAALAREMAPAHQGGLASLVRSGEKAVTSREVYEALARGDSLARAVHAEVAEALAHGIAVALALLAPDTVVLGGGVLEGAGALVGKVAELVPEYVYAAAVRDCRFEAALLGADAGLLGACLYGASRVLSRQGLVGLAGLTRDARSSRS
jgi:glucokinase